MEVSCTKPRILIVLTPAFHPNAGGVQMSTWKMSKFFSENGRRVGIFSFSPDGHVQQEFAQLFTVSSRCSETRREGLKELERVLNSFRPDVVINQMPYEADIGDVLNENKEYLLLGCLRNTLFSVKSNIDNYGRRILAPGLRPFFRNALGRFVLLRVHRMRHKKELEQVLETYDRFVMFGPPNLDELRFFLPDYDRNKIALIPNSVPAVLDSVPTKEKRILWLGRLAYEQKRAELILPLWRMISAELPDWHLDVVGDGPAREEIAHQINKEGLERVVLHGRQEPDDFYRCASIFVMTSAYEGFPNTLVEAQSFGAIPVLFDTFPVAKWVISDSQGGFLVKDLDLVAMANRILSIARSDERTKLMSGALENARRFHIDSVGQAWLRLLSDCGQRVEPAGN